MQLPRLRLRVRTVLLLIMAVALLTGAEIMRRRSVGYGLRAEVAAVSEGKYRTMLGEYGAEIARVRQAVEEGDAPGPATAPPIGSPRWSGPGSVAAGSSNTTDRYGVNTSGPRPAPDPACRRTRPTRPILR